MFPINWNDLFRKKDGTLGTMEDLGGGGNSLPEHSSADAGKVLTVDADGSLIWSTPSVSGNRYSKDIINSDQSNVIINESEVV